MFLPLNVSVKKQNITNKLLYELFIIILHNYMYFQGRIQ